ncbi:MAG: DUF1800 domain-containing protein [Nitrospirae bacterium]|nr:DUF1800 domain-containing protein [Nitrospirota bacterium]MBI3392650.1 DUF1800 domain-containing protein [Nitrospirota bacterium]
MNRRRDPFTVPILLLFLILVLTVSFAQAAGTKSDASLPSDDEAIVHLLNRIGYGPRPGDIPEVRKLGIDEFIEKQLSPDTIPDAGLEMRLEGFKTLKMTTAELIEAFPPQGPKSRQANAQPRGRRPGQEIILELSKAKLLRAVYSERRLQEVMTDFWFNHFNVFAGKGIVPWVVTSYERDVIRPRALGKFRDLLGAVAESPAMLFYLDNWMSAGTSPPADAGDPGRQALRGRHPRWFRDIPPPRPEARPAKRRGINENYARELLELHTLGVDGGYTQEDVRQVALAFTGWTIAEPRRDPRALFNGRMHDGNQKTVLGRTIPPVGGAKEGDWVLDLLARHPKTAEHISRKLAVHFVSDDPPPALVARLADTFRRTDGDIRALMKTLFHSPEFWGPKARQVKTKTPLHLVVSALRATGTETDGGLPLLRTLREMGEPLYLCQPPTGYKDESSAWTGSNATLQRTRFAAALTENRLPGTRIDLERLSPPAGGGNARGTVSLVGRLLAGVDLPETLVEKVTRSAVEEGGPSPDVRRIAGLILGSPAFQAR